VAIEGRSFQDEISAGFDLFLILGNPSLEKTKKMVFLMRVLNVPRWLLNFIVNCAKSTH
jgi:hypothetical protein